jgi:alkylated DNA repair dioxygenase AlkB
MGSQSTKGRRGGRGVPANLAAPAVARGQLALPLREERDRSDPREVLPGAVLVGAWLDLEAQRDLVADFRDWSRPPAGLRQPRLPNGSLMSVQAVCLGWHWYPYVYSRTADDTDGAPVKPLPARLRDLGRAAVAAA